MTQIFFPPTSKQNNKQVYCYVNRLSKVVIVRILGLKDRQCERVVFPGENFLFTADDDCKLEINQQTNIGIVQEIIACFQLKVSENYSQFSSK